MRVGKIEKLEIGPMVAEGKCVARYEDKVVFVDLVAPGDIVDVLVTKQKKNFLEATPVFFHQYSSQREKPFCIHFGVCGGCKWQHLNYPAQLKYKEQQVVDSLERLGKISLPNIQPILASSKTIFYRNKLEFTFSNHRWLTIEEIESKEQIVNKNALGFHIPKRFDKIIDVLTCHLQPDPSNAIRLFVKDQAEQLSISFFDLKKQEGVLRNLLIRTSNTGGVMVILQFFQDHPQREKLLNLIRAQFPQITSLYYIINPKRNETFHDIETHLYYGEPHLIEQMEDLKFRIGPKSFFQTNSDQAYQLYSIVRQLADIKSNEVVYDLYTGTGTIALFLARHAKRVVGLEYVEMAVDDAKANAVFNKIDNASFIAGDIKDLLTTKFIEEYGRPAIIITDPPRSGMHPDVVKALLAIRPTRIVYVSCNPATQARDLSLMNDCYTIKVVQPVDMFPHTHHVENVVLMELKN